MVSYPSKVNGNLQVTGVLNVTPGGVINLGPDANLYRSAGNLQTDNYFICPNGQANGALAAFGGDPKALNIGTVGGGLAVKEGANARSGVSTLVAGTVTVSNTSVTATSRIQLTSQADGGTPGFLRVSTRTAGTSFTILSSSNTDTSTVAWFMVEPS